MKKSIMLFYAVFAFFNNDAWGNDANRNAFIAELNSRLSPLNSRHERNASAAVNETPHDSEGVTSKPKWRRGIPSKQDRKTLISSERPFWRNGLIVHNDGQEKELCDAAQHVFVDFINPDGTIVSSRPTLSCADVLKILRLMPSYNENPILHDYYKIRIDIRNNGHSFFIDPAYRMCGDMLSRHKMIESLKCEFPKSDSWITQDAIKTFAEGIRQNNSVENISINCNYTNEENFFEIIKALSSREKSVNLSVKNKYSGMDILADIIKDSHKFLTNLKIDIVSFLSVDAMKKLTDALRIKEIPLQLHLSKAETDDFRDILRLLEYNPGVLKELDIQGGGNPWRDYIRMSSDAAEYGHWVVDYYEVFEGFINALKSSTLETLKLSGICFEEGRTTLMRELADHPTLRNITIEPLNN